MDTDEEIWNKISHVSANIEIQKWNQDKTDFLQRPTNIFERTTNESEHIVRN